MNNASNQSSTAVESSLAKDLAEEYFRSFNENQFEQTAALFAEEGALIPPFDSPVVGEQAILAYLEKEAGSITAFPKQWDISEPEDDLTHIVVTGKVNAVVFKVNVAWYFAIRVGGAFPRGNRAHRRPKLNGQNSERPHKTTRLACGTTRIAVRS